MYERVVVAFTNVMLAVDAMRDLAKSDHPAEQYVARDLKRRLIAISEDMGEIARRSKEKATVPAVASE